MRIDLTSEKPIFLQISDEIEEAILIGAFEEETQVPSTTEISTRFKVNPATVLKGMNLLADEGIIYKKRGLGMFVKDGSREEIRKKRYDSFYNNFVKNLIDESKKLGMDKESIISMIERGYTDEQN